MQNDAPPDQYSPLSGATLLLETRASSLRNCFNQASPTCRMAQSLRRKKGENTSSWTSPRTEP
jgi:hypothetical protein